ncbi:LemA family protein [Pectinatus brassicae]|uniref:LemA protein n=1 Tax=Pectinatus brassicae TaxID=862415 RepID=A0A840UFK6_9FIRM|nr:LemA family protein [Pectinatus brassicae]MBB5336521.1 LemA protein [Pectinatus brassicae]
MKKIVAGVGGVFIIICVAVVAWFFSSYNSLITQNETVSNKWAQVENNYQRRADLIPNLVNTVEGYSIHEEKIMQDFAAAQSQMLSAKTPTAKAQADSNLTGVLSRFMVVVQRYPELKADKQFTRLMDELAGTENRLSIARKDYDDAAQQYNIDIKRIPTNFIANINGFQPKEYFKAEAAAAKAPTVNFN